MRLVTGTRATSLLYPLFKKAVIVLKETLFWPSSVLCSWRAGFESEQVEKSCRKTAYFLLQKQGFAVWFWERNC